MGRIQLRGPEGALDIYVAYFPTGSDAGPERRRIIQTLSEHMEQQQEVLSLIMGDFNFAARPKDRWCKEQAQWTGGRDSQDADLFEELLCKRYNMKEIQQPAFTCDTPLARSRIDRVYSNHHTSDQLDRSYGCNVLAWTSLSQHRPISFSRIASKRSASSAADRCPNESPNHPDWTRRVTMRYDEQLAKDALSDNPVRRLVLLKRAMRAVALTMQRENKLARAEESDDQLGWTMSFIRAAEDINLRRMQICAMAYPKLATYVSPEDLHARIREGMSRLREHALQLAKDAVTGKLQNLQRSTL